MSYGKIFNTMYDGTLAEDWRALITFQQFIVLCNQDGIVDMTAIAISRRTGIPIEHIKAGIEILEKEDRFSRTADKNGKRIVLLDDHRGWGWQIVNHKKYMNFTGCDTIREQNRARQQRHRDKIKAEKNNNVTVTHGHARSRHIDKDKDKDKDKQNTYTAEFEALWKAYPKRSGNNPKGSAFAAYKKQKDVHGHDALMDQVSKYAAYIQHVDHVQTEFVKHTSSFFGKDFDIDCQWDLPRQTANSTAKPSWSKIPQSDDDLWAWAKQHGYPDPGKAQDYYQYRATLKSVVEQRIGAEGLH